MFIINQILFKIFMKINFEKKNNNNNNKIKLHKQKEEKNVMENKNITNYIIQLII